MISRKLFAIFILSFFVNLPSFAQNSTNYLSLTSNVSPAFTFTDATGLESTTTLSNAYTIKVRTKSQVASVFARISSWTTSTGYTPLINPVSLLFKSTTSTVYNNLNTNAITLTSANQQLFKQGKKDAENIFIYDMILNPVGYDFPPGSYSFTISFTMTQP
jgi:hypothetical protein